MKIYSDENNINILQPVASASTMIGSLAYTVREYILSRFQKNFFKHVYIDTSETIVQENRNYAHNQYANKIPYPSMTISPEISLDDPVGGMGKSMHLSSPNLYMRRDSMREYKKIVVDPDEKFSLLYTGDYITTNFNVKIVTNTYIQNADMAFYIKSAFQNDFFQYLNGQHLQTEIPKSFVKAISDIKGWNLDNPEDMNAMRLYLIGAGKLNNTIQKRRSLSTGKECFFVDDTRNLLVLFTDLDCPSSISRTSQVEDEYIITFRLQISCYLTNAFILSLDRRALRKINRETIDGIDKSNDEYEIGNVTHLNEVIENIMNKKDTTYFFDNEGEKQIGHLVYHNAYIFNADRTTPNLFILDELSDEFKKVHEYAINELNIDASSLIHVKMFMSSPNQQPEKLFNFDPNTCIVELSDRIQDDFVIAVYVNRLLYESVRTAIEKDVDYFGNGYLTSIMIKIGKENLNAVVRKFENKDMMRKSEVEKSLRIRTAYGIGYVSLLEDKNDFGDYNSYYKICVGFDKDNKPIIKRFETLKEA